MAIFKDELLKFLLTILTLGYLFLAILLAESGISTFEKGVVLAPLAIVLGIRLSVFIGEGVLLLLWLVRLVLPVSEKQRGDEVLKGEDYLVERYQTQNLRIVPTGKSKRIVVALVIGFLIMITYIVVITWREYINISWFDRCVISGALDSKCNADSALLALIVPFIFCTLYLIWSKLYRRLVPITVNRFRGMIETPTESIPVRSTNIKFEVQLNRTEVFESFLAFILRGEAETLLRDTKKLVVRVGDRSLVVLRSHDQEFLEGLGAVILECLFPRRGEGD